MGKVVDVRGEVHPKFLLDWRTCRVYELSGMEEWTWEPLPGSIAAGSMRSTPEGPSMQDDGSVPAPESVGFAFMRALWSRLDRLLYLGLSVVIIGFSVLVATGALRYNQAERWGYVGVFLGPLLGSSTIFFPAPNFAFIVGASQFLNPIACGLLGGLGWALGEMTGYAVGRLGRAAVGNDPSASSGRQSLFGKVGARAHKYGHRLLLSDKRQEDYESARRSVARRGMLAVFFAAVIPNPLFDMVGIAAGAARMRLWRFLAATIAGRVVLGLTVALLARYAPALTRNLFR